MPNIYVARRPQRKGLMLPMEHNSTNPALLFPLLKGLDRSELDELIRAQLDKIGITKESDVQGVVDKAEADYEQRVKVAEAVREIRRLMELRKNGAKLMSVGHKKWRQVFYRPLK